MESFSVFKANARINYICKQLLNPFNSMKLTLNWRYVIEPLNEIDKLPSPNLNRTSLFLKSVPSIKNKLKGFYLETSDKK